MDPRADGDNVEVASPFTWKVSVVGEEEILLANSQTCAAGDMVVDTSCLHDDAALNLTSTSYYDAACSSWENRAMQRLEDESSGREQMIFW